MYSAMAKAIYSFKIPRGSVSLTCPGTECNCITCKLPQSFVCTSFLVKILSDLRLALLRALNTTATSLSQCEHP